MRFLWPALFILLAALSRVGFAQAGAARQVQFEPLWQKLLLGGLGAVIGAMVAIFTTLWTTRQQRKRIDREIEARLKAEARTEAARLRSRYLNALPFHTIQLRDHLTEFGRSLADSKLTDQIATSFSEIKRYGARELDWGPERFSAACQYQHIFAISTLYYISVFLFFSQRIRSLAPFSEVEPELENRLNLSLQAVTRAFVSDVPDNGLWEPCQNGMAAMVGKDDWYLSYPEFCSIFVDIDRFRRDGQVYRRDDHVFMRALDYFGAFSGPPRPLITHATAATIVDSLNALLRDLDDWRKSRDTPTSSRSRIPYLPFWKSRSANAAQ